MSEAICCPACGATLAANEIHCSKCGFQNATVQFFADEKSFQLWENERSRIANELNATKAELYRGEPLLSVCSNRVAILNPKSYVLRIYTRFGAFQEFANVKQVQLSDSHFAILFKDGSMKAEGDNNYSQCNVTHLQRVKDICAFNNCTLAVNADGTLQVRGYTPLKDLIEKWDHLSAIWGNSHQIVGVKEDGSVVLAAILSGNAVIEHSFSTAQLGGKAKTAVACTLSDSHILMCALLDNGHVCRVTCSGTDTSLQSMPESDYIALAATSDAVLLLRNSGEVTSVGTNISLQQEISQWRNTLLIAGNENGAASVDQNGLLHLAGGKNYCQRSLLDEGKWDPSFIVS